MSALAKLEDAIAISDAALKACPVNTGRCRPSDKCPICGAIASETCFRAAAADYRAMEMVRQAYKDLAEILACEREVGHAHR